MIRFEEYKNMAIKYTRNPDFIATFNMPGLINAMAIKIFMNGDELKTKQNGDLELMTFIDETREMLLELRDKGYIDNR